MKKISLILCCLPLVLCSIFVRAQDHQVQDAETEQDSTVDVIGWFEKNDTLDYWIYENRLKINDNDTTMTAGVASKVRLVVTDSTSNGYKMDYTFLEFQGDSLVDSALGKFQNELVEMLGNKFAGTTVRFETDELGKITKMTNLKQLKKTAKSQFEDVMDAMSGMPEMQDLKEIMPGIGKLGKFMDSDDLVDGYIEELQLLFAYHGSSFNIGEFSDHEDATDSQYENDTYIIIESDPEEGTYSITNKIVNIIPRSTVKELVGGILTAFSEENLPEDFDEEFDKQVDIDATVESYLSIDYFFDGWPYALVKQESSMIGGCGKIEQTYIRLTHISE